jgi:hypothetical protein
VPAGPLRLAASAAPNSIRYASPRAMAKKTRKQKQRAATRRPGMPAAAPDGVAPATAAAGDDDAGVVAVTTVPAVPVAAVDADPTRRRVERVSGLTPGLRVRPARSQAPGYIQPLESDDAAIPFDRVPYVPADLRRVAIIAGIMIALIIIADIIVSNVVK